MDYKELERINKELGKSTVDIKGKDYVLVNKRVAAFRELIPGGLITTEIVPQLTGNGIVTIKATVADEEGSILATGMAQEKEASSFINKTSYIENCETSAVGRALGFVGIGIDASMASAEEVANAIKNQTKERPLEKRTAKEQILIYCKIKGLDAKDIAQDYGLTKDSTEKDRLEALQKMKEKYGE